MAISKWKTSNLIRTFLLVVFLAATATNYMLYFWSANPDIEYAGLNSHDHFINECDETLQSKNCSDGVSNGYWSYEIDVNDMLDFKQVLLGVQFNDPHYVVASKVYTLYSRIFGDIVFCGPETDERMFWPNNASATKDRPWLSIPDSAKFVAYGKPKINQGENGCICLDLAAEATIDKGKDYEGILVAGDDVMLNVWTWRPSGKSLTKNWVTEQANKYSSFDVATLNFCYGNSSVNKVDCLSDLRDWQWAWIYRAEVKAFFTHLEQLANLMPPHGEFWNQMLANLSRITKGPRRLHTGYTDIFYVTMTYLPSIRQMLKLMNKHRLFVEFALHSAIRAATPPNDLQLISINGHDWGNGFIRYKPMIEAYWNGYEYVHPFKLGLVFRDKAKNFVTEESMLIKGLTRGLFRKNDTSIDCVYCYIRKIIFSYSDKYGTYNP